MRKTGSALYKIMCFESHQQTTSLQEEPVQELGSVGALRTSESPDFRYDKVHLRNLVIILFK